MGRQLFIGILAGLFLVGCFGGGKGKFTAQDKACAAQDVACTDAAAEDEVACEQIETPEKIAALDQVSDQYELVKLEPAPQPLAIATPPQAPARVEVSIPQDMSGPEHTPAREQEVAVAPRPAAPAKDTAKARAAADALCAAGQTLQDKGNVAGATQQYEDALKQDPDHQGTLYRLGVIYAKQKKYPQAINTWTQYVHATNGTATAYSNLGFCYELAGQTGKAEEAFKAGLSRDPNSRTCRTNYGLMLARLGRPQEAQQQLLVVLTRAETHYNLGMIYDQLDRPELAKEEYRKALKSNPKFKPAQDRLADLK